LPAVARRVFKVKIPRAAAADIDRFLERLNRAIHSYGALMRVEGDSVIIEVYGTKSMIRDTWIRIKKLLSEYAEGPQSGFRLARVYRDAGLALPADVISEVLRYYGYKAEADGVNLYTNAPYEDVLEAALKVKDAIISMRELPATRTAKKAVATLSAVWGESPQRVIELLLESGHAVLTEEGKLELIKPWKEVVSQLWRRGPRDASEG